MPKAKKDDTTGQHFKRQLFGAGAALLRFAPSISEIAERDDDLLTTCIEYEVTAAECDALDDEIMLAATSEQQNDLTERLESVGKRRNALRDQVAAISAETLQGVVAKALAFRGELAMMHASEIDNDCAEPEVTFAWSLVHDILGRA